MDSFKALWIEFETLQEENEQLREMLEILQEGIQEKARDCLDMLQQGHLDAAREILEILAEEQI